MVRDSELFVPSRGVPAPVTRGQTGEFDCSRIRHCYNLSDHTRGLHPREIARDVKLVPR